MNVHVGQVYVKPGIGFPFSHLMQRWLSNKLSSLSTPSPDFVQKYGADFDLVIRISAETNISDNVIRGPTVFRRGKDIEYTIFLPFDIIRSSSDWCSSAMRFVVAGVRSVFNDVGIETNSLDASEQSIISHICSSHEMLRGG